MNFSKRPIRDMDSPMKFRSPGMYDHDKIERGIQGQSKTKYVKGSVVMKNHSNRDNAMYNFNRKDLREINR